MFGELEMSEGMPECLGVFWGEIVREFVREFPGPG